MRILGVDPGLQITGYGLIDTNKTGFRVMAAGFIRTSSKEVLAQRLLKIHEGLSNVIHAWQPQTLVLEKLYAHYRHPVTASLLGHARGVICMLAAENKIHFFEYPATKVKKIISGSGHASKLQIKKMIEHLSGLSDGKIEKSDTTDAIALALTHAYFMRAHS